MNYMIGPVLASAAGYMVCALLRVERFQPFMATVDCYLVFAPNGACMYTADTLDDALEAMANTVRENVPAPDGIAKGPELK